MKLLVNSQSKNLNTTHQKRQLTPNLKLRRQFQALSLLCQNHQFAEVEAGPKKPIRQQLGPLRPKADNALVGAKL